MLDHIEQITVDANTPAWHEERKRGIGGSDASAVVGQSKWMTPYELWLTKRGLGAGVDQSIVTQRGKYLEDGILNWYTETTEYNVLKPRAIWRSKEYPFMQYTPDAYTACGRNVQVKSTTERDEWGEPGTDQVPKEVLIQVQHEMAVSGFKITDIPVLFPYLTMELFIVPADQEFIDLLVRKEGEFWQKVIDGVEPELMDGNDISLKYPRSVAKTVEASDSVALALAVYKKNEEYVKQLDDEQSSLLNEVKMYMADADTLTYEGQIIATWRSDKRGVRKFLVRKERL